MLFFLHMKNLIGTARPVRDFDLTVFYGNPHQLTRLNSPFTLHKIEWAVRKLAKNKAVGPDALPNEFAHIFWDQIKEEVVQIIQMFHNGDIDLKEFNRANIIMIPKHEIAEELKDYQPISIINLIPKIISKILEAVKFVA